MRLGLRSGMRWRLWKGGRGLVFLLSEAVLLYFAAKYRFRMTVLGWTPMVSTSKLDLFTTGAQ